MGNYTLYRRPVHLHILQKIKSFTLKFSKQLIHDPTQYQTTHANSHRQHVEFRKAEWRAEGIHPMTPKRKGDLIMCGI